METRDETTAASKLIDVLSRIDTTLETLDRRLQALEHSWQTAAPAPDADRVELTDHVGFATKVKVGTNGSRQVHEITIGQPDFLSLLLEASSPCLNRHRDADIRHPEPKTFTRPFTELLCYRDILRFAIDQCAQPDNELRELFSQHLFTIEQKSAAGALLSHLEDQCKQLIERRDANLSRGVILFDDLPSLYSPGSLLIAPGESGAEQVVEVSSCDVLPGSTTSEVCVVEVWYFRWDGQAFSRASDRFQLDRYVGTRPIGGLAYRPLIEADLNTSITELEKLHLRNHGNLGALKGIFDVDIGDYPVCPWISPSPKGSRMVRSSHLSKPSSSCPDLCPCG